MIKVLSYLHLHSHTSLLFPRRVLHLQVDHMLRRQSQAVVHPQQMYLKKRKELYSRYTMPKATDKPKKSSGGGGSKPHDSTTPLSEPAPEASEDTSEVVAPAPPSPKPRVRFAATAGSRPGTSVHGRRRPGTSSGTRSALKYSSGK